MDVVAEQSFFSLRASGDVGLTISQMIFSGSYVVGLQASKAYTALSEKTTAQTKEQIIMQVTKAYYAVLINKERTKLFTSNIARVDSLLKSTKAMNANGFAESIDVDRTQVTYNNLVTQRDNFINTEELSKALLKFQMNYPLDKPIDVLGDIEDVKVESDVEAYKQDWDYKARPDYKVLVANQRLQQLNIKNQYFSALPYLAASANYGYYTQSSNVAGLFKTKTDLSKIPAEQLNGMGADKWYSYTTYSVTASIPLFTGFQRQYRVQQEKLKMVKIDNNFKNLRQSIDLEISQGTTNFQNSLRSLVSQKDNMDLAGKVAKVTKIKYEQGVGSNLEVVDAENSLRQAQTNYYSALFDAMVAKVDLDKAYGKILPANQTN
jgi:outer membrane protein TolC